MNIYKVGSTSVRLMLVIVFVVCVARVDFGQQVEMSPERCITRFFPKVFTSVWSESEKKVVNKRCDDPSPIVCDIMAGIKANQRDGVACLLDTKFDFNSEQGVLLFQAAVWDDNIFRLILERDKSIDLEQKDKDGRTLLGRLALIPSGSAINRGKNFSWERILRSTEILLKMGADPNPTVNGITPLMSNAKYGSSRFVQLLLRNNANPNVFSEKGETVLMMSDDHSDKIRQLIDYGANIYAQDFGGMSVAEHAISNCQPNKLSILLSKDSNILSTKEPRRPLGITDSAVSPPTCKAVKVLIENATSRK